MAKLITTLWFHVLVVLTIYSKSRIQCWESSNDNDGKRFNSVDVENDDVLVRKKRSPDANPQPARYRISYRGGYRSYRSYSGKSSSRTSSSSSSSTYYIFAIVYLVLIVLATLISCIISHFT